VKYMFAIQNEITKNIITALQVKLTKGEQALDGPILFLT